MAASLEKNLIPKLTSSLPDVEALRLYLTLPECPLMSDENNFTTLAIPFGAAILNLEKAPLKVLGKKLKCYSLKLRICRWKCAEIPSVKTWPWQHLLCIYSSCNSPVRKFRINMAWCKETLILFLQGELPGHPCESICCCSVWTDAIWEELNCVVQCHWYVSLLFKVKIMWSDS